MIKSLFVAVISLLALNALARTIENSINDLMSRFEMPELGSIYDEKELYWFVDRDHITDPIFFYNSLMSELKNPKSFPQSRQMLAKYVLCKYLTLSESDRNIVGGYLTKTCVDILVKGGNFQSLFELVVSFESNMIKLMNSIDVSNVKSFTEALFLSSLRNQFMDVIRRLDFFNSFIIYFFSQLIILNSPEEFYLNFLTSRFESLIPSYLIAINEYTSCVPMDLEGLNRVNSYIQLANHSHAQQLNVGIEEVIAIIYSSDNVTLSDLNINLAESELQAKMSMAIIAANHGKDVLLSETINDLNDHEKVELLKNVLLVSKRIKPSGLKAAVRIYNLMPERVRGVIHESEEYLQAAVQWLRLENLEILTNERNYNYKLIFKADSEQIADGLFEEMVYYHRNDRPLSNVFNSTFGFDLKFVSPEAFANIISQDIRALFTDNYTDFDLPVSKDTMKLLAENEYLRIYASQNEYKIAMEPSKFLEFIEESSLESIPKMKDLLRNTFLDLEIISNVSDFVKIEKFADSRIIDIVNQALNNLQGPLGESEYFKIRNALVYLIGRPYRYRLNELPSLIKESLIKEFPGLSNLH